MIHGRWIPFVGFAIALAAIQASASDPSESPNLLQTAKLVPFVDLFEDSVKFGHAVAMDGDLMVVGARLEDALDLGSGAAYVFFRADGDWYLQAKLVPSDGAAYDEFGWSVAIDGLTVVVGAWLANGPLGSNQGAAYVFARSSDGEWSEQVKLEALDGGSDENFGYAVAVDGDTVLVGARRHSATAYLAGAAYVFVRSGPGWTQQQKLESNDIQSADLLGTSVAIEGETAVIGASHDDHAGGGNEGSAYVFTRSGTVWSQQQRLFASDAAPDDFFASSVAISGDTVVAGTWEDDHAGGDDAGSAYVFLRSGNTWTQQQKLVAADAAPEDAFGYSVAVDGDTAVVGAIWDDDIATDGGSAYVFVRSGNTWSQQQELAGAIGSGDLAGCAVAVSGDTIVVGAREDDTAGGVDAGSATVWVNSAGNWALTRSLTAKQAASRSQSGSAVAISNDTAVVGQLDFENMPPLSNGAAYVFARGGGGWVQQESFIRYSGPADCRFGRSVAVDSDIAIVGAPGDELGGFSNDGFVTAFVRTGTSWATQQDLIRGNDTAEGDLFGHAVSLDGPTLAVGAPQDTHDGQAIFGGSVYIFVRSGASWTQQAKIVPGDIASDDHFGTDVALYGDTVVIGAPDDDNGGGTGAGSAYVFTRSGTSWTQQAKIVANDGTPDDSFGTAVDLDDATIIVGAPEADHTRAGAGAAYVFVRAGSVWSQLQKLGPSQPDDDDRFGHDVSISGDTAVIAASRDDHAGGTDSGAAYVFALIGPTWTEQQRIVGGDSSDGDQFGYSVAVEGHLVVAGAPLHDALGKLNTGATYVFEADVEPTLPFSDGFESGDTSGWSATVSKVGASLVPLGDPVDEYWTSLRLDPAATRAVTAGPVTALVGLGPGPARVFTLELRRSAEGLEIRAATRTNAGRMARTDWAPIGSGRGWLELDWRRSAEDQSDGRLEIRIDGAPILELRDLVDSTSTLEAIAVSELHGRPIVELAGGR